MNIYALVPLIAAAAYVFLLATTAGSRPWNRQSRLFIWFLAAAALWSVADFLLRSTYFRSSEYFLGQITVLLFTWMAVQFHTFTSSFYPSDKARWLVFAYISLTGIAFLVVIGYLPQDVLIVNDKVYPQYGPGIIALFAPLVTLLLRNLWVLSHRLKTLDNPALYNQIVSLIVTLCVLFASGLTSVLPWGREFPAVHVGAVINAFILMYATIRHQLVDIRTVLRYSVIWFSLIVLGATTYGLLLVILHSVLPFQMDMTAIVITALVAAISCILVIRARNIFSVTLGKAFQGNRFDYRQKLSEFASRIHNLFSLREQGGELLSLLTKSMDCQKASLMFPVSGSQDFITQLVEPKSEAGSLADFKLKATNPIVAYLREGQKPLTRQNLNVLTQFKGLWAQEKEEIKNLEIELFVPIISRGRLIAILVLCRKYAGRYSLEDFALLEDISERVAVSIEKEYLQEQLKERERELSVVNRSSTIFASSFDIREIYESFIHELKRIMDVNWAAITLVEGDALRLLALYTEVGSAWQVDERVPIKGTATEWVVTHKKPVFDGDMSQKSRFLTWKYHLDHGLRSIVYVPLIAKGEAIGAFTVAGSRIEAYNSRQIHLLEQLASQIAMPVENALLYADVERRARTDGLTGLLNRRSLDEMIAAEINRYSRYGGVFSLMIFDLDSFKAFNDTHGHLAGDRLLVQVGATAKSAIRSIDQAFRYGGDEFAILMPQTKIADALEVAERVRSRIIATIQSDALPLTVSVGVAGWPMHGIRALEVIAAADMAMYQAKRNGGNQLCSASSVPLPQANQGVEPGAALDEETLNIIYTLAAAVDARDHFNTNHSRRVQRYAMALGEAMNLDGAEVVMLGHSALLHDIGKVGIGNEILNKSEKLEVTEVETLRGHAQIGASMVSRAPELARCAQVILHHHEKYDGSGYPDGLKGEAIPLGARILAVADAYAAMTSERPYSKSLSPEAAVEELQREAGKQFDPRIVDIFVTLVKNSQSIRI